MSTDGVDKDRRRPLPGATTVAGGDRAACVLAPFVLSMEPSARAQAAGAPVEADINKLEPGRITTVAWRGKPVRLQSRTDQTLKDLPTLDSQLRDPKCKHPQQPSYAQNECRARRERPHHSVAVGVCTHQGRIAPMNLGSKWKGGFFSRHGSRYDLTGRVFKGVPAPLNRQIPPYQYLSETNNLVGKDEKGAA